VETRRIGPGRKKSPLMSGGFPLRPIVSQRLLSMWCWPGTPGFVRATPDGIARRAVDGRAIHSGDRIAEGRLVERRSTVLINGSKPAGVPVPGRRSPAVSRWGERPIQCGQPGVFIPGRRDHHPGPSLPGRPGMAPGPPARSPPRILAHARVFFGVPLGRPCPFLPVLASARGADLEPVLVAGVCSKSRPKEAQSCQGLLVAREWARRSPKTSTMAAESVRLEGHTDPDHLDWHDRGAGRQGGPDRYQDRIRHHGLTTY
jgi:hypothetical protein